jgi:hypothetical protein
MCTVVEGADDEVGLKMGQVNGNGYHVNGNGIPSSSSRFVPSPPLHAPPAVRNGAKAGETEKSGEVKKQKDDRDGRHNGDGSRSTRSTSDPAAASHANQETESTVASCVSAGESAVSKTRADRQKEKPLVDQVYDFLVNDVDYVLAGSMGMSADGHPTFGQRPRAGPKSRCSPEEQLLCVNLLRQLEFVDMESADLERIEWKLTRCFRLLNSCGYPFDDIVTVVAFAAIYFPSIKASVCSHTGGWDKDEVANVMVVLIYISHAFCFDETCPIGHWHTWVVRSYCSLQTLNLVVLRILQLRRFHLTVTRKEWRGVSFALKKGMNRYQREQVPEGPEPVDCFDDSGSRIKSGSNAW